MYKYPWTLDTGHWTLDTGHWTLDTGHWTLDSRLWTLDSGLWTLDSGLWTLDSGHWTLDSGLFAPLLGPQEERERAREGCKLKVNTSTTELLFILQIVFLILWIQKMIRDNAVRHHRNRYF